MAIRVTDGDDFSSDVQNVNIVEVAIANVAPTATFGNDILSTGELGHGVVHESVRSVGR